MEEVNFNLFFIFVGMKMYRGCKDRNIQYNSETVITIPKTTFLGILVVLREKLIKFKPCISHHVGVSAYTTIFLFTAFKYLTEMNNKKYIFLACDRY